MLVVWHSKQTFFKASIKNINDMGSVKNQNAMGKATVNQQNAKETVEVLVLWDEKNMSELLN